MSTEIKDVLSEIKAGIGAFDARFAGLQKRFDDFEVRGAGGRSGTGGGADILQKTFEGSEDLQAVMGGRRKSAILQVPDLGLSLKATIDSTAVGRATSGVLNLERIPGVVPLAQRKLFMRDLLQKMPCTSTGVDYVKESVFYNAASPQNESLAKGESELTFTTVTARVQTIASWIPASRQVLDDMPTLLDTIRRKLIYGYLFREDQQILLGDGTGVNLSGLAVQATAFSTSLLGNGVWHKADLIRRAMQQVATADESGVGWIVMHPVDFSDIELAKDTARNYISGDPRSMMAPSLWGVPIAVTTAIPSGKFLVGSNEAADLRIRQEITFEISTEHSDFFSRNLVALRVEGRVALPVYRPAALIYGTFTTSPA